jgi:exodeoxyribonuclease VII small subunit
MVPPAWEPESRGGTVAARKTPAFSTNSEPQEQSPCCRRQSARRASAVEIGSPEVPKTVKQSKNEPSETDEISFEEAMKRLESIVDEMETDEPALETLLSRYEEGAKLVAACREKLAQAELKIQKLEQKDGGDWTLEPVDTDPSED